MDLRKMAGYFFPISSTVKKRLYFTCENEAADAVEIMRRITDRNNVTHILSDALNTYWDILRHQANGGEVVYIYPEDYSKDARPQNLENTKYECFVKDKAVAKELIDSFGGQGEVSLIKTNDELALQDLIEKLAKTDDAREILQLAKQIKELIAARKAFGLCPVCGN